MPKTLVRLVVLAAATALGVEPAAAGEGRAAPAAAVAEHVESIARERSRALVARDIATLERILAPQFVYTNASGVLTDKQAYLARVGTPRVQWISQELSDVQVRVVGDTAVLTAAVHDRATFDGEPLDARFRSTFVYVRSASGWICVAGHTSPVR